MPGAKNGPSFINLYLFSFPIAAMTHQISCVGFLTYYVVPYNMTGLTGNERPDLSLFDSLMIHTAGKRWFARNQGRDYFLIPVKKNWQKAVILEGALNV